MKNRLTLTARVLLFAFVIGGLAWCGFRLIFPSGNEKSHEKKLPAVHTSAASTPLAMLPSQSPSTRFASKQAAEADTPARGGSRLESIDTSLDLFAFAVAAANSTDATEWAQGFAAVSECMAVKEDRELYEKVIAAAPTNAVAEKASKSATLVMNRCRGFLNNERVANAALRKRLIENIRNGTDYVVGVSHGPLSGKQFESMLLRKDFLSFGYVWSKVLESSLQARNLKPADPHSIAFSLGYWLAQCDIGGDCTRNSFRYAQVCVREAICEDSLEEYYQRDLPVAFRGEIARYRQGISRAFRDGNITFFGMNSN